MTLDLNVLQHDSHQYKDDTHEVEDPKRLMKEDHADEGGHHRFRTGQDGHNAAFAVGQGMGEKQIGKEASKNAPNHTEEEVGNASCHDGDGGIHAAEEDGAQSGDQAQIEVDRLAVIAPLQKHPVKNVDERKANGGTQPKEKALRGNRAAKAGHTGAA